MISDVPIIRYDEHRFFHYAIFKTIALAYFSIFLLENLAENCLNVAFHDDHLQNYVLFTISRKKILEKNMKNPIPPVGTPLKTGNCTIKLVMRLMKD